MLFHCLALQRRISMGEQAVSWCASPKAFHSSFHAPTYLWNHVLKTKPIFKAGTIFLFTALLFSWGRETLAKSVIPSVKIIILAYNLSFFSWGFIRGIQGGWYSPSELFLQSSPRQLSLGMHPFSVTRLSAQLSHSENVAISNCAIRHGSIIYNSDANSLVLWYAHIQSRGRRGIIASLEPTEAAVWPFLWKVLHLQMDKRILGCFFVITLGKWLVAIASTVSKDGWLAWAFVPYVECAVSHLLSPCNNWNADFCWGKCQH